MSEASAHEHSHEPRDRQRALLGPVRAVGFWSAVALPFLYPVFLLSGQYTVLVAAIVAHAVALFVGHAHNRDD